MGSLAVVVVGVDAEHAFEVTGVQDQQPVETLGTHSADEALRDRTRLWRRTGVFTMRMPSLRNTSSKGPLYLLSRSRIRNRTPWSENSRPRLRACCVTQTPVGLAVQPASQLPRCCDVGGNSPPRNARASRQGAGRVLLGRSNPPRSDATRNDLWAIPKPYRRNLRQVARGQDLGGATGNHFCSEQSDHQAQIRLAGPRIVERDCVRP